VLDGEAAGDVSTVGFLGGNLPPVRALIDAGSAQLYQGDLLMQAASGALTADVGPGTNRVVVGVLTDPDGAVAGDLAEVTFFGPQIRT